MRIVFCGSPDFAIPSLRAVSKAYQIVGVFTQPDRVMGKRVTVPPVKEEALALGLPVYQFDRIGKDGWETLLSLSPDLIVTCAFGQFLTRNVLALPPLGVVNVHASLLPKYRGAAPIQSAILNGDRQTGVSIMRTVYEMDAGDVILCEPTPIGEKETAGELFDRLSVLGAEALLKALALIQSGEATYTPQKNEAATFCTKLDKNSGLLDFSLSAEEICNRVRAFNPWPSAYTYLENGNIFKILLCEKVSASSNVSGKVIVCDGKNGIVVSCGKDAVRLLLVQEGGGKKLKDTEYANAHNLLGAVLGKSL